MRIPTKELKRGVDYYLTFDFWPKGGTKVRVKSAVKGNNDVIVIDEQGNRYIVNHKAWLFDELPIQ